MAAADLIGTDGVVPLRIGTPFLVGAVNVWLIEDEPLTLVDTGANTATALLELRDLLAERGHRIEDVGRIVLTHHHVDHVGLAGPLAALTGAEVVALEGLDGWLAEAPRRATDEERHARDVMRFHGVSDPAVDAYAVARLDGVGFYSAVEGVRPVRPGDDLEFAGRTLRVHHVPGHSVTDTLFEDRDRGVAVGGDHLLAHQAPLPFLAPPITGRTPDDLVVRRSPLLDLRASLRRTRELGLRAVLPGHGDVVAEVAELVDRRLAEHDAAAAALHEELRLRGPGTAHELVLRTAPRPRPHPYFALCVTVGTLDQLVDEGGAAIAPGDGPPRYEAR
jgi:glyoxylase-like metal-dependent hydrolase (beta-lactamase superfamily II)